MEEKIQEKYLPIGSVVLLHGGTKKAMITGFCSVSAEDKTKVYDYTGCVYPEGYLDFNEVCLFDHDQIEAVYHIGFINDEEINFKKELKEIAGNFKDEEMVSKIFDDEDLETDEFDDDSEVEETTEQEETETTKVEELEYL